MILDKLMEKKDLINYIDLRIETLKLTDIKKIPVKKREKVAKRLQGKVSELIKIKHHIIQDNLKHMSKEYYKQIHKKKEDE